MFLADTNILIYAAIEEFDKHHEARQCLDAWRRGGESWFVTWPIIYEFLRVVTHRSVFEEPIKVDKAWSFIDALFDSPSFGGLIETTLHRGIVADLLIEHPRAAGNLLHDLHTASLMKEHGITEPNRGFGFPSIQIFAGGQSACGLSERIYFAGARRFSSSAQCCTTMTFGGPAAGSEPPFLIMRNR